MTSRILKASTDDMSTVRDINLMRFPLPLPRRANDLVAFDVEARERIAEVLTVDRDTPSGVAVGNMDEIGLEVYEDGVFEPARAEHIRVIDLDENEDLGIR